MIIGQNKNTFLYPAHCIFDSNGKVQIYVDDGEEIQIDFASPRMKKALKRVSTLAEEYPEPRRLNDILMLVEKIGDVEQDCFGLYNNQYFQLKERHRRQGLGEVAIHQKLYQEIYAGNNHRIMKLSDQKKNTFLCTEFAASVAVLCHQAGLNTYILRAPCTIAFQHSSADPLVYSGHSAVVITDEREEILCLAECSTAVRRPGPHWMWFTTIRSIESMTIADLVKGKPFIGVNYQLIYMMSMGDPLRFGPKDYFAHSQFDGTDYKIRSSAVKKLFEHYKEEYHLRIANSELFLLVKLLRLEEEVVLEHLWLLSWGNRNNYLWLKEQYQQHQSFALLWLQTQEKGWKLQPLHDVFEAVKESLRERALRF